MLYFNLSAGNRCNGGGYSLGTKFTWKDKEAYVATAHRLACYFINNFEKYKDGANEEILAAAPKI